MSEVTDRAALAERAARAGAMDAQERFREALAVETKADKNDLVTQADRDAQLRVIETIAQELPTARLVCEEDVEPAGTDTAVELLESVPATGEAWVVDPIDGTTNYVHGIRFWGTSVAAVTDREPVAAATALPALGDVYAAGPARVTRNGTEVAVSERSDPGTFVVGMNGWWPIHGDREYLPLFEAAIGSFGDIRRLGSMQATLALVAAGGLDAAVIPTAPHPWDSIAGVHLVRLAGGTATDVHGDRWQTGGEGLVVSNGQAHDRVVEAVARGLEGL